MNTKNLFLLCTSAGIAVPAFCPNSSAMKLNEGMATVVVNSSTERAHAINVLVRVKGLTKVQAACVADAYACGSNKKYVALRQKEGWQLTGIINTYLDTNTQK